MLTAIPKSIFSWGFEIYQNRQQICVMDMRWICEGGSFEYARQTWKLAKTAPFSGSFTLENDGIAVAAAQKTMMMRYFEVSFGSQHLILKATHPFTRRFLIQQDDQAIGTIGPKHAFTRHCMIDLPEEITLPVQVFLFWLVALMWRRSQNSGD